MQSTSAAYPSNPIVCRVWRGERVESVHRGAWCVVDSSGTVLDGAGDLEAPYFVRSAIKSIQALPLLETGAAERFSYQEDDLALALASHSGEPCHTRVVTSILERLGLGVTDLACGAHPPNDPASRRALQEVGASPSALHNNCSGKHAGFLALGKHLDVPVGSYLDPSSAGQQLVLAALGDLTDVDPTGFDVGVDGCSAPTYRVPLSRLALAFSRIANPDGLAPERRKWCARMTGAARDHPVLIAGAHRRIDTDLIRASGGRLFPKIGAEAVHAVGIVGADRALALKVDDGAMRAQHVLLLALLERFGFLDAEEGGGELARWRDPILRNHAGLAVGRIEAVVS